LLRRLAGVPFTDERGHKGWFDRFSLAQPYLVRSLVLTMPGWPRWTRAFRVLFLSDFHFGSHSQDVERFERIVDDAGRLSADLVLFGGDYVNMAPFGGGRIPPRVAATVLARLDAPCGRFAVLGNHDVIYDANAVNRAFRDAGVALLDDEQATVSFDRHRIAVLGIPDAEVERPEPAALIESLPADQPTIIVSHDPVWFETVRSPSHLMLSGHTHGGQVRLPFIGPVTNRSRAPLRWSYGHIVEDSRQMIVTSGLGSSVLPIRIGVPPEIVVLDLDGPSVE
jgi:predicted MPP superfamily phosphohydrolase